MTSEQIIIIADSQITEAQKAKAREICGVGENVAVNILGLEYLQVTEGRHLNPVFNADGQVSNIEGYQFTLQVNVGENTDGTKRSARGHISLGKDQAPAGLKAYAHYMEGMDTSTRLVNPMHVFSTKSVGNGTRLVCESANRSWYSMKPLGGAYILHVGAPVALEGNLKGKFRTPILSFVIAEAGDFGKTISEREVLPAVVMNGWNSPAESDAELAVSEF